MKVKIYGYSQNEGYRVFEILDREQLEEIIDAVDREEIYRQTFEKARRYHFSGDAYTYVDARDGKIVTHWQQKGTFDHPWDSFYEIVICSIATPVRDFETNKYLDTSDKEEMQKFYDSELDVEDFIRTEYGEEELERRIQNIIDFYACDFGLDFDRIKEQLDNLYPRIEFSFRKDADGTIYATAEGFTNAYTPDGEVDTSLEHQRGEPISPEEAESILEDYGWAICKDCGNIYPAMSDCPKHVQG